MFILNTNVAENWKYHIDFCIQTRKIKTISVSGGLAFDRGVHEIIYDMDTAALLKPVTCLQVNISLFWRAFKRNC